MMNKTNNLDKLFREELVGLEFSPRDDAWENILKGLDQAKPVGNKRNNRIFYWSAAAAASVAILIAIYLRSCEIEAKQIAKSNEYKSYPSQINLTDESKFISNNDVKSGNTAEKPLIPIITKNTNSNLSNSKFKSSKNNFANNPKPNFDKSEDDYLNPENSNFQSVGLNANILPEHLVDVQNNINNLKEPVTSDEDVFSNGFETTSTEKESIKPIITKKPTLRKSFSVGANYGLSLISISGFESANENITVKEMVKPGNPTSEGGLDLRLNLGKFNISSGITVASFGENHSFDYTVERHDTSGGYLSYLIDRYWTYKIIGTIEDPNDPNLYYYIYMPVINIDTMGTQWNSADRTYYTKEKKNSYNQYRFIEIPFILGYSFNINRFSIDLGAGISTSLKIKESGFAIKGDGSISEINQEDFSIYKSHNFNFLSRVGLRYNIDDKLSLGVNYNFRNNLTSIYKPEFDNGILYTTNQFGLNFLYKLN